MSQAFAGLDTSRSVGVFGDQRVWGYIIILRAVRTKDFMSAEVFNFDNSFIQVYHLALIAFFRVLITYLGCRACHLQSGRWCVPCCL
jgi:hypothetical protein